MGAYFFDKELDQHAFSIKIELKDKGLDVIHPLYENVTEVIDDDNFLYVYIGGYIKHAINRDVIEKIELLR